MPNSLVIVESPAKARTISKILGKNYTVKASVGHILDLPKDRLGVDINNGFTPQLEKIKGKGKIINELKNAAKLADEIFLATDPDREGEAIAAHIADTIANNKHNVRRVLFHEITKNAILKAIKNSGTIDYQKVDAQQARRVLDRLVGYQVSPVLWKTVSKGLSAGRVQSVALRLICEREDEIAVFRSEEYWSIEAELTDSSHDTFRAQLAQYKKKKIKIPDKTSVDTHLEALREADYYLKDITNKKVKRSPYPPFTTSTLQQEAARRFHYNGKKTMGIAQSLYEGVEIGDLGSTGLITYMRTDSIRSAPEAIASAREYIAGTYGVEYLPDKPRIYKTKGRAQEAHEAIRPTQLNLEPKQIKKFLTPDQFKLYSLIFTRFVASQMKEAVFDQTTLEIEAGDYIFRVTDTIPVFRGYLQGLGDFAKAGPENGENEEKRSKLPSKISVGEKYHLLGLFPEQHFTEPPPRYNDSSLVKTLDELGIGRPSTYASIVSTLFDRKYIVRTDKKLFPTELGSTVNSILINNFPDIFTVDFTARMENQLDFVEAGEQKWNNVIEEFYEPFTKSLDSIKERKNEIKESLQEKTGEKCEKCGSDLVIKWGKNGKFIACSNFPKCRNTRPLEKADEPVTTDKNCPNCGSKLVIKNGKYGQFYGCSSYPKCKHIEPITLGVKCPKDDCDGDIVERRSKRGKVFYGCTKYPKCDYVSWYKPVDRKCPECGHKIMEIRKRKDGEFTVCPECKHTEK